MAGALKESRATVKIVLDNNQIGVVGAKAMAEVYVIEALRENKKYGK